jgi:hypothetical protein
VAGPDQRIGLFIADQAGNELADVKATAEVFSVANGGTATAVGPAQDAVYHGDDLQQAGLNRGVYTIHVPLKTPGRYKVVVHATRAGQSATSDATFIALATDPGIPVGAPAPRSRNPIAGPGVDIGTIDTGNPPDDMHYVSIVDAIDAHHPTVIYFGTPGFCQSRTCAPEVQVVQALETRYRSRGVDFIHVETYKGGRPDNPDITKADLSPTFIEWKLTTEPWIVLVNGAGVVTEKFAGATGPDEVRPGLDLILGG